MAARPVAAALTGSRDQQVRSESAGPGLWFGDPQPTQDGPACRWLLTGDGVDPRALVVRVDTCLASPDETLTDDPFEDAYGPSDRAAGS